MDKETREYVDQKSVSLVRKEDIEKLRQESKANFRQLREEGKTEALALKEEIHTNLEESRKQWQAPVAVLHEEILKGFQQLKGENQSVLGQSNRAIESSLQKIEGDVRLAFDQSRQQCDSIVKEGKKELVQSIQENRADMVRLIEGLGNIQEQIKKAVEGMEISGVKVREGLTEVKEELGSMIKFSYADLERRLNALEARIKVLEKIVLQ